MLIRGGENIYCIEVENALYEHPAVVDAAVVGIPHRTLGEEPAAVVTLKPGAHADEAELRAFVAERLAAFKVPVKIVFCREIPAAQSERQDTQIGIARAVRADREAGEPIRFAGELRAPRPAESRIWRGMVLAGYCQPTPNFLLSRPVRRGARLAVQTMTNSVTSAPEANSIDPPSRRDFLYLATASVAAVGAAATLWPFIDQMNPDASTVAAGGPIDIDLKQIEPGQQIVVLWSARPVFIANRTKPLLDALQDPKLVERLSDPNSTVLQQPSYAVNWHR